MSAAPSSSPSASRACSPASPAICGSSRYVIASVEVANGYELNVIAACVIGGISIAGGIGSVGGAVLGALFLGIIQRALPVINVSPFWQMAISGSAIILAVVLNARGERRQGRIILRKAAHDRTSEAAVHRRIPDRLDSRFARRFSPGRRCSSPWRSAIFIVNSLASPYFLNAWSLSDLTFNFTEKALIALAMALLIISGEIDLSVAAIIALASTLMGMAVQAGVGTPGLVAIGIASRGSPAAPFNGLLVTRLGLPSIVVTIGTMSLFRGISYIILGDQAYKGYPASFAFFGQGYVWWVVSFELVLFLAAACVYGFLLHRTSFGRRIFAIGNNPVAAQFSGVRVERIKFLLFCLTGLMAGIASVLITSRLGSTRPSIAQGYELEAITMVVLGGVSILGGAGSIPGVVLAAFIMGLVTFGLGLLNVPGIVMSIFVGLLLIVVIALPIVWAAWRGRERRHDARKIRFPHAASIPAWRRNTGAATTRSGPSSSRFSRRPASATTRSTSTRTTEHAVRRALAADGHHDGRAARPPGDAALVGAHGRHHGDQPDDEPVAVPLDHRLPHGMTGGAPPRRRHRHRQDQRQARAGRPRHGRPSWRSARPPTPSCRALPTRISTSRRSGASSSRASPHFNREQPVDAMSVTTHGAAAALVGADGAPRVARARLRISTARTRSAPPTTPSARPSPRPAPRGCRLGSTSAPSCSGRNGPSPKRSRRPRPSCPTRSTGRYA